MFHRVKSEVQEPEQRVQPQRQKIDTDYRQEQNPQQDAREDSADMTVREELKQRIYLNQEQSTEQEETRNMSIRQQEDKDVQGKYAPREPQDNIARPRMMDGAAVSVSAVPSYQRPGMGSRLAQGQQVPGASVATGVAASNTAAYTPSYSSPYAAAADAAQVGDRTLTIGRGINMSGEIEACDHLVVEGTVEAALKGAKILDIAESGTFYGTVEIEEATVAGRFEGDITVNGRLTIRASGTITGSIAYRELEVEAGAMLDGRMTPLRGNVDPKSLEKYRAGTDASAMAKAKDSLLKKDNREPANTDPSLYSKAHGTY